MNEIVAICIASVITLVAIPTLTHFLEKWRKEMEEEEDENE